MIPLVDLRAQYAGIKSEIDSAITGVLESAQFIQGDAVRSFEAEFAQFCGVEHAIGVASGTAALHIGLRACGIGPGDEIITTPFTFIATVEAIAWTGATPVLVDIDPVTYNIDPAQVETAITERTRAVIPVHLYGHPADMGPLMEVAETRRIKIIEDAAQAHGAEYQGRRAGSMGIDGCFSFYPAKNLGAYGDGGMITTDDPEVAERVRRLRDHGREEKYTHIELGLGERLDTLQAAILRVKLRHLEEWTEKRRRAAAVYNSLLSELGIGLPQEMSYARHVYHLYVVRVPSRDSVLELLGREGIGAGVHYPIPIHLQPGYRYLGYGEGSLPNAERAAEEVLSLPMYPELTEEQAQSVATVLKKALSGVGTALHTRS